MKISSVAKLGGVALLSALVLAGCGSKSSQSGSSKQKLNWMIPANVSTMDPSKMTDLYSAQTANATNEGLLRMAPNSKVDPGVAKSYQVSKDGKTWTFNLRHSKWSDGSPVTAKDFVYSWRRTVTPKTASQYAYIFANIKNASKINAGKMSPSKLGVKADGNYKLKVQLIKPQSYFKFMVAQTYFLPEKKSAVQKYGSAFGTKSSKVVYNGPFLMKNWTGTNDTFKLVKNPKYWNAKNIKLQQMTIQAIKDPSTSLNSFQSGKIDYTTLNGTQVKQYKNDKQYKVYKEASTSYLELNQKKYAFFRNKNIRKAISLAIDRHQMTSKVLADGSQNPKGYVPDGMSKRNGKDFADAAYTKNGVSYNLAQAKKYWAKGMKETGKKSVSFNLLNSDDNLNKNLSEYIQSQLTKLPGFHVNVQSIPFKTKVTRSQNQQFDMVLSAWIADYPDPSNFLDLFTSTNAYNDGKWSNKQYDALMKKSESTDANNEAARWNDMVQAEKILMNDQGIVPLFQQAQSALLKSKVQGVQFLPTSPEWDWSKASIK